MLQLCLLLEFYDKVLDQILASSVQRFSILLKFLEQFSPHRFPLGVPEHSPTCISTRKILAWGSRTVLWFQTLDQPAQAAVQEEEPPLQRELLRPLLPQPLATAELPAQRRAVVVAVGVL